MISAESVKAKLKNLAIKESTTMQNELILYGLERAIYRLSISKYANNFTLKGGIFLYALFERNFTRATQDIDLLAANINNEKEKIKNIFEEIFLIECDDALYFDISSLNVKDITEFKEYHGVNVSIIAYLDRTRIPISIDIGFGDKIHTNKVMIEFPTLLDMDLPKVYAYSIYSVIAEKFEAIVSLGLINSRYKDFYDIFIISKLRYIDGNELKRAIIETFSNRNTSLNDIVAFNDEYMNNKTNKNRWISFVSKKQINDKISFEFIVLYCKNFLKPIVDSIKENSSFDYCWDSLEEKWIINKDNKM